MKNLLKLVKNLGKAQSNADKNVSRANSQSSLLSDSNSAIDDSVINRKYSLGGSNFFGIDESISEIVTFSKTTGPTKEPGKITDNKDFMVIAANLNQSLQEKHVMPENVFSKELGKKSKGISSGNIAKRKEDKQIFMLKEGEEAKDSMTFLREFIAAPLFKRVLNDSAPAIGLAADNSTSKSLQYSNQNAGHTKSRLASGNAKSRLTSKFLPNYNDLESLYVEKGGKEVIERATGWEKVLLSCVFMGDTDFHGENLGVIQNDNEDPKIAKIDHGFAFKVFTEKKSLIETVKDMSLSLSDMYKHYEDLYYRRNKHNQKYDLAGFSDLYKKINIENLRIAAKEISTVSIDEINNMIDNRIDLLKKTKFKPKGSLAFRIDSIDGPAQSFKFSQDDELNAIGKILKARMAVQLERMKDLSIRIQEFSSRATHANHDMEWSNGGWLKEMAKEERSRRKGIKGPWSDKVIEEKNQAPVQQNRFFRATF